MTSELMITDQAALAVQVATAEIVDDWLDYERANGASEHTVTAYRKGVDVFIDWMQTNGIGEVMPMDVNRFKSDLAERYSVQTVNLRLTAVRSFYRFCVESGRMAVNPAAAVKGMKRRKSKRHKRDMLTNGEVIAVLNTCDLRTTDGVRDRAILTLMAYCGLRTVEVYRANISDLRTRDDRLTLDVHGKGTLEKDDFVVVRREQEPFIRAWLVHRRTFADGRRADAPLFVSLSNRTRGDRLALSSLRELVKARYNQAGVVGDRKTTHSLRHSAITNVIRHGATPMQAQSFARHSSMDTTLIYYHETSRLDSPAEDLINYENGSGDG